MKCTKINPPLPAFVNFYYYYTSFILFLCLLLAPFQFYIILTKSKNLKSFKWLILNHSFWSLLFEILFTVTKPLLLPPAIAVYPIGFIQGGGFSLTVIGAYIGGFLALTFTASLTATLINRYLMAFPTIFKMNEKYLFFIYILGTLVILIIGTYAVKDIFNTDPGYFYQAAIEYDPCMQIYVKNESGFVFWPETTLTHFGILLALLILFSGIICAIFLGIYFIYLVKSHKSQTLEKLQRSLIISAIVQLSVTISLLFIPVTICVAIIHFEITEMENFTILLFCIILSHFFFESLTTLYFVNPYRKAVIEILGKYIVWIGTSSKTIQISPVTQTDHWNPPNNRNQNRLF